MINSHFTSFKFSKKLSENGCDLKFNNAHEIIPTYDIIWDICIKYVKEFFGKECIEEDWKRVRIIPEIILLMIQRNKTQQEIEKFIWDNCLFNPKNKESTENDRKK